MPAKFAEEAYATGLIFTRWGQIPAQEINPGCYRRLSGFGYDAAQRENQVRNAAQIMVTTRIAKLDDLKGILDITNWAIRETPSNFNVEPQTLDKLAVIWQRTQEHYPWLVATECDKVLAFASASPYKARAAYRWTAEVSVYVSPAHQSKGIGRTLQSALISILEAQGYRTLVAAIALPNAP